MDRLRMPPIQVDRLARGLQVIDDTGFGVRRCGAEYSGTLGRVDNVRCW